jgi:hypothetical protein
MGAKCHTSAPVAIPEKRAFWQANRRNRGLRGHALTGMESAWRLGAGPMKFSHGQRRDSYLVGGL